MKRLDLLLIFLVIGTSLFGLLMIFDASSFISFRDFGTKYHYSTEQLLWMVLGFAGLGFFSWFDYKKFYNLSVPLLIGAIGLLVAVFLPGLGIKVLGAHRWINLHFFVLQPAEFVKLTLAIYLAAWFSSKEKGRFMAFLLLLGLVLGLVLLEPDMGTAIIILCEAFVLYFLSGGKIAHFLSAIPVLGLGGLLLAVLSPYRAKRLATFLNPSQDSSNSSYHIKQILIALGSGGWFGVGLGNSLQKYAYLPENTTDSIFAIIAEEIGFVGSLVVLFVLAAIVWCGIKISIATTDPFGRLLAGGITAFLASQMLINLGAQTALMPLTGVPLPFISYGGSALVVDLCSVGILLNIARRGVK
ncbi:MAG TPA: putative peptidoglycan glycosyltransferase FtsW [Patescibacteria group bacterium]|nr:putative peptidoglycan glycosyltransferase FtsW [Patescibacteria group bacterium]